MSRLNINGLKIGELIGYGECGRVYAARNRDGARVAVKVFNGTAISRANLQTATQRLGTGGWPDGVMHVIASDFSHRPPYWVTPLLADNPEHGKIEPRSLQHRLHDHPGPETWRVVREIAAALAAMHHKRVAHANLKPGNVFFDESGGVLLTDWAQGNMPGVGHARFTDALLYQPPEQLRSPDGYLREEGYRCDVYAFGTLAYRLLTGGFPRCHDIFIAVAPPPGMTRRDNINADLSKIAKNLENHPEVVWPDESSDEREAGLRDSIVRCLELDPHERPASMAAVLAGFARIDEHVENHREHAKLLDQRRREGRRALHAYFALAAAAAAAVVMAALWHTKSADLENEKSAHERTVAELTTQLDQADAAVGDANAATASADSARREAEQEILATREAMQAEIDAATARFQASREIGDRLFTWAIEQDHRRLPPLDGRRERLMLLESHYNDFLERTSNLEGLDGERARTRLQLAEISLAAGDTENARTRLERVSASADDHNNDASYPFRMARNMVLLALLHEADGDDEEARATFLQARELLETLVSATADESRVCHLAAIADVHEARYLTADGDEAAALDLLKAAAKELNQLADARPDAAILHSELAEIRLASAVMMEGMGRLGDASDARELAAEELQRLLEENPGDLRLKLELAGSIGSMAEAAVLSGDIDSALAMGDEAVELLDAVIAGEPENPTAVSRKAAQLGLRAGVLRDEGKADEAVAIYQEGIGLLESALEDRPGDGMATYRLALLTWQMARMKGINGEPADEITMLRKAAGLLDESAPTATPDGPNPMQRDLSAAYLHGDLGHALELSGEKKEASAAFARATVIWAALVQSDPDREEFAEGLAWCERRLSEIGDPPEHVE